VQILKSCRGAEVLLKCSGGELLEEVQRFRGGVQQRWYRGVGGAGAEVLRCRGEGVERSCRGAAVQRFRDAEMHAEVQVPY